MMTGYPFIAHGDFSQALSFMGGLCIGTKDAPVRSTAGASFLFNDDFTLRRPSGARTIASTGTVWG